MKVFLIILVVVILIGYPTLTIVLKRKSKNCKSCGYAYTGNDLISYASTIIAIATAVGVGVIGKIIKSSIAKKRQSIKAGIQQRNEAKFQTTLDEFNSHVYYDIMSIIKKNLQDITFTMEILADTCEKILCHSKFNFLPKDYKYNATAINKIVEYFDNKRISTLQEGINLYIQESTQEELYEELRELEQQRLAVAKREVARQKQSDNERIRILQSIQKIAKNMEFQQEAHQKQLENDVQNLKEDIKSAEKEAKNLSDSLQEAQNEVRKLHDKLES